MTRSPTRPYPRAATACSSWRPRTTPAPRRCRTAGPHYVDTYTDALAANGQQADVYDIDAAGRIAPDALGVLSHYDAVVWETGNDLVTRTAGRAGGNADRLALDELLEFRSYMNEGGKVLLAGDSAGQQYTNAAVGNQLYDPKGEIACNPLPAGTDPRRCLPLFGSFFGGDTTNDVLQYYLGGYVAVANDGHVGGAAFDSTGVDDPFTGLAWGLDDPVFAGNTVRRSSFLATSGILPTDQFKQFDSWPAARYDKPGGPFDPHTGTQYVYSQIADVSYKRLTREIAVPAAGGSMTFWTSYDTEAEWDHLFVEARTPGGDDWTTLPDANGHTTTATGQSCPAGWVTLHPQLAHYQTWDGVDACTATGTTGAWNAASGNSAGWQEWSIDLSAYAGETVEISIAYASDWAIAGHRRLRGRHHAPRRHQHLVRDRPGRLGDRRAARGQRAQRQRLHPHRRIGLPGRQRDLHAALAAAGVRTGGRLD